MEFLRHVMFWKTSTDETTITTIKDENDHHLHRIQYDENGTSVLIMSVLARSAIFTLASEKELPIDDGVFITIDGLADDNSRKLEIVVCEDIRSRSVCKITLATVLLENSCI
jgi:hypothetical protein